MSWQKDSKRVWHFAQDKAKPVGHKVKADGNRKVKTTHINIDSNENAYDDGSLAEGYRDEE